MMNTWWNFLKDSSLEDTSRLIRVKRRGLGFNSYVKVLIKLDRPLHIGFTYQVFVVTS